MTGVTVLLDVRAVNRLFHCPKVLIGDHLRLSCGSWLPSLARTLIRSSFTISRRLVEGTAATMNPGFPYVAVTWQIAAEAIVPLNREGGNGMGFRAQLLFFIDDLLPSLFGKPLLTNKPERSLIAWH